MRIKLLAVLAALTLATTGFVGIATAAPDKANLGQSCEHISDAGLAHSAAHVNCDGDGDGGAGGE